MIPHLSFPMNVSLFRSRTLVTAGWLVVALLSPLVKSARTQTPADFGFNTLPLPSSRPVLIILANFQGETFKGTPDQWHRMLFAQQPAFSVDNYMRENSNRRFSLISAGWQPLQVTMPSDDTWNAIRDSKPEWKNDPTKSGEVDIEFVTRIVKRAADSINFAANFRPYDTNGDGVVQCPEELTLCLINSLGGSTGGNRDIDGSVNAGGVSIAGRVITCGHNVNFATLCHEFGHSFGINHELYTYFHGNSDLGVALDGLTIMSGTIGSAPEGPPPASDSTPWEPRRLHFDPWCKMRFGWSEPRIVSLRTGGKFDLPAATSRDENAPLIVYDPSRARRYHEYFILEYRSNSQPAPNYDASVNDNGLLIWHVETQDNHSLIVSSGAFKWQPADPALLNLDPGVPFPFRPPRLIGYSSSILARCPPDMGVWHNRPWPGGQTTPPLKWFNGTATQTRIRVLPFTPGAPSITVEILPEQGVWVDFAWTGAEQGNFGFPFNTLNEGISRVGYGGPLWIKTGRSNAIVTGLDRPMTIHAYGGEVTLGR